MPVKRGILILFGLSYGVLSAAGVFTALAAVGLVPRFVGRTHTAGKARLYENCVIGGTIFGCVVSVFPDFFQLGAMLVRLWPTRATLWKALGIGLQGLYGMFAGMFVGCMALAIAEMLDSIPIMARRFSFRKGLAFAVFFMALGKTVGSLLYFSLRFYRVGG